MKQIKLSENTNGKLDEIRVKRKEEHNLVRTKQSIVEQLIEAAYKKEVVK